MRAHSWTRLSTAIAEKIFGGSCYLCRGESAGGVICAACASDLPRLDAERCPRCALPAAGRNLCGRCLGDPPAYDATVAALAYAFPADVLVQGLKYRGELALASLMSAELGAAVLASMPDPHLSAPRVDFLVPVPLHPARLRQRGYNQSMEISRGIAVQLRLPIEAELCERLRDTPAQLELPLKERRRNVRGAFSCRRALDGRAIAVVDDVMTSGATLNEVAATLKRFGAARVVNWVVARTAAD